MFRCDECGKQQKAGTKVIKHVTHTRSKNYVNVVNGKRKVIYGYETVKELNLCKSCYGEFLLCNALEVT